MRPAARRYSAATALRFSAATALRSSTATALRFSAAIDGLSAENIALIVAVGFVLGTFPVFGCPTVLCLAAAMALRMNLPALLVVNHISSPLQLALIVPLARLGARIVGVPSSWNLGAAALQAIAGWLCLCVPLGCALYLPLAYVLRQRRSRLRASAAVGWLPSGS